MPKNVVFAASTSAGADSDGAATDDQEIALQALRDVAGDATAQPSARAAAARTLLEVKGLLGKHQPEPTTTDKPLSSMSAQEIDEWIEKINKKQ